MATTSQLVLVKPVPTRALAVGNRSGSPQGPKQLSARTGSVSAPDPYATRPMRPPRGTVSKLTIVRVPQSKVAEDDTNGCGLFCGRKAQRRKSVARASGFQLASPTRISFASSSFSTAKPPKETVQDEQPNLLMKSASATSAPRRPQAPSITRRHTKASGSVVRKASPASQKSDLQPFERLQPTKVFELAKSSTRPTADVLPAQFAPSSLFKQLSEEVYLPFLDRPTEILELLTLPSNGRMMVLFARLLPSSIEDYYPRSSAELAATIDSWTFEDFTTWLTQVSREEIEDELWVRALRAFVLPKSEVLWTRLKELLGVPPELDIELYEESEKQVVAGVKKAPKVDIVPIYPVSSSGLALDDISENAEAVSPAREIVGLRISTTSFAPLPSSHASVKNARTAPSSPRTRTPVHGYAPLVSSPLVPKPLTQLRPRSAPPQKSVTGISSSAFSGLLSRIQSKEKACPMFPSSFDKVGIQPTLLRIA